MTSFKLPSCEVKREGFHLSIPELELEQGDRVAVIGANGSGKSTYFHAIEDSLSSDFSFLSQEPFLVELLSVYHNIYAARLNEFSTIENLKNLMVNNPKCFSEVIDLLGKFGIGEKIKSPAGQLSGGEKQKLTLARAIYSKRSGLLADEPISAIAKADHGPVLSLLFERFKTSMFIIHQLELLPLFSKVLILDSGKLQFYGDVSAPEVKQWLK